VLDAYDGRRWSRASHRYRTLERSFPIGFYTGATARERVKIREEFILEPMDVPALIVLGRALEIRGRFAGVLMDEIGNLRGAFPPTRIRYEVVAALDGDRSRPTPETLELPEIDPRIRALAAERTAGVVDDAARARALLAVFAKGFSYSLEVDDVGEQDPLAHFLFEARRGHCEYFASSLAVLLRAADIPARIVNGYRGGEWNDYGGYFLVRQSDAHSWVEAWVDGEWQVLDPTPVLPGSAARASNLAAWMDAARMRWYRYVVNYGASDQVEIAFAVRDGSRRLRQRLGELSLGEIVRKLRSGEIGGPGVAIPLAVAIVVVGLALAWRRRATRSGDAASVHPSSVEYRRLLVLLGKRGFRKGEADTAEEFLERISPELGGAAPLVGEITERYQAARFSGREEVAATSVPEMHRLLEEFSTRLRA
jgi:transglutaminase-like putative cysteine protease